MWPPLQLANFALLPTEARVAADMGFQLLFDTYVSYLLNDAPDEGRPLAVVRIC